MINHNYQRHYKQSTKKKSHYGFVVFAILLIFSIAITYVNVLPIIRASAVTQGNLILQSVVNDIANKEIVQNASAVNRMLTVTYKGDRQDQIAGVSTNAVAVSTIKNAVTQALIDEFSMGKTSQYKIALSTLLGYDFLVGSKLFCNLHINPFTSIDSDIDSVFEGAGVNQTKISIMLNVSCVADISIGSYKQTVTVNNSFILAQKHIIGEVPSIVTQ